MFMRTINITSWTYSRNSKWLFKTYDFAYFGKKCLFFQIRYCIKYNKDWRELQKTLKLAEKSRQDLIDSGVVVDLKRTRKSIDLGIIEVSWFIDKEVEDYWNGK